MVMPTPERSQRSTPGLFTVTTILVAINLLAFVWELASGTDFSSNRSLYDHGALFGVAVQHGSWWRVVTGAFLHGGFAHVALNMVALYVVGRDVEWLVGHWRMLAIYAIALGGSGWAVVTFSPGDVTVGASGAIFGLFGALVAFGLRMGARGRRLIAQMLPVLALNLAFTFAVPFISKAGHVGGLVSGFVAGLLLFAIRPETATPPAPPLVLPEHASGA